MLTRSKIIIVGKGGSGKDFLRKKLEARGFVYSISHTSRPKREGEVYGKDYKFVDESFFINYPSKFYEIDKFNGWYYGTTITEFKRANLIIMTPNGIKKIRKDDRERCFIIFIDPDKDVIRKRLMERGDVDSVDRRIESDNKDFFEFSDYDMRITNHDF